MATPYPPPARTVPIRYIAEPGSGVTTMRVDNLLLSPLHRRSVWGDMDGLAKSIRSVGVIQPLVVRRVDGAPEGQHEVVAGARRLRAAMMIDLTEVDVVVRVLTDEQVLDYQLEENRQRHHLHPVDEAALYQALILLGRSAESIAALQGVTVKQVRGRLKLCSLADDVRASYIAGELSDFAAFAIARIPNLQVQAGVAAAIAREEKRGPKLTDVQVTDLVRRHYHLPLARAPWDRDQPVVGVDAPACRQCPSRTLAQRDLFDDLYAPGGAASKRDDFCMEVQCWTAKLDAHWVITEKAALDAGHAVIAKREAAGLWLGYAEIGKPQRVRPDGPYVDVEEACDGGVGKPWGEAAPEVAQVLVRDPDGIPRWLMDAKEARRGLGKVQRAERKAAREAAPAEDPVQGELESPAKADKAAQRAARRKAEVVTRKVIAAALETAPKMNPTAIINILAPVALAALPDAAARILKRTGGEPGEWLRNARKSGFDPLCQMLVELLLEEAADQCDEVSEVVLRAAKDLGADVAKARRDAKEDG